MGTALTAEIRKLLTTRAWWVLTLVMLVYLGAIAGLFGWALGSTAGDVPMGPSSIASATTVYALVNAVGYVFPLIIGSLLVTAEYRHHTIVPTLLAEPRRGVVLAAKLLLAVPLGAALGAVATLSVVAVSAPSLALLGDGAFLGESEVLLVLAMNVVAFTLWTVIGVAFGAVVTNQVIAVVALLAFTQLVEPILRVAVSATEALSGVADYLPGAAADALIGASFFDALGGGSEPARWVGAVTMLAYAAVFAALGFLLTTRRDIE